MAHAHRFDALMGTEAGERGADAAIAAVAQRQHGVITRAQLLEIGVGPMPSRIVSPAAGCTHCIEACMRWAIPASAAMAASWLQYSPREATRC